MRRATYLQNKNPREQTPEPSITVVTNTGSRLLSAPWHRSQSVLSKSKRFPNPQNLHVPGPGTYRP